MKPAYLLTIGDKVKTQSGVIGTIAKIYSHNSCFVLKTDDGYFTCERKNCKEYKE